MFKFLFIIFTFTITSLNISAQQNHKAYLTQQELEIFKNAALNKVRELEKYIVTIADKNNDDNIRKNSIDLAVKLFESERNIVEVTSRNSSVIKDYIIRDYLNRLRILPYARVSITWYDISYVSDFVQDPDGNYRAIITIFQKFEGFMDGRPVYKDITQKNIEIVIKNQERYYGDRKISSREVLLGNIRVVETRHN